MDGGLNGALASQIREIAGNAAKYIIVYVVLWAGAYIYIDLEMPDSTGAFFLMSFVGVGLNFFLLYSLVQSSDAADYGPKTGLASFFGLSLLHSIAIFAGLVFLIIPGLFLCIRWLPAFARLLNSDEGLIAAFDWSWDRTKGHELTLAGWFLGLIALYLIAFASIAVIEIYPEFDRDVSYETLESLLIPSVILSNVAMALGLVWYTLLGVASYVCLLHDGTEEAEEFE